MYKPLDKCFDLCCCVGCESATNWIQLKFEDNFFFNLQLCLLVDHLFLVTKSPMENVLGLHLSGYSSIALNVCWLLQL